VFGLFSGRHLVHEEYTLRPFSRDQGDGLVKLELDVSPWLHSGGSLFLFDARDRVPAELGALASCCVSSLGNRSSSFPSSSLSSTTCPGKK